MKRSDLKIGERYALPASLARASGKLGDRSLVEGELVEVGEDSMGRPRIVLRLVDPGRARENQWRSSPPSTERIYRDGRAILGLWADHRAAQDERQRISDERAAVRAKLLQRAENLAERLSALGIEAAADEDRYAYTPPGRIFFLASHETISIRGIRVDDVERLIGLAEDGTALNDSGLPVDEWPADRAAVPAEYDEGPDQ